MTTETWQRVQDIFDRVLEAPPAGRATVLDEACGDDAELRAEVESLLEHESQAGDDFLVSPVSASRRPHAEPDAWADKLLNTKIGRYTLTRLIAAGGMGCVFEAKQDQPARSVALKILRPGLSASSALARFRLEPEVLGRLRHPNIAQVFEAGVHEDERGAVPYFAMELIPEAQSLSDYADAANLAVRQRLELFARVCDAVHHGHQKGIIHRDLKPANILVDSSGEPKVIDFGVARATDSDVAVTTLRTDVGELIGTLQYMSPEQCAADPHELDTRSDVYSLGVVLYELLCGQRPYDLAHTPFPTAARIICERAPARPSTIDRKLRGDLELIVLKALEKDAPRRYQSTAELAADIRRYLNREPIAAKTPTAWTRAVRWVTRHPRWSTLIGCLMVALVVVGATYLSVWLLYARPYKMVVSEDYKAAWLVSLNGNILHEWSAGAGTIASAELVVRPTEFGGDKLALIASSSLANEPLRGSLSAFDIDQDLEQPIWRRRIKDEDVYAVSILRKREFRGRQFNPRIIEVADIFTDANHPGDEVVVTYQHSPYSQCAIRIYNLNGKISLYQIWQDGGVGSCYWMAGADLLIFQGADAKEHWDARGHPEVGSAYPWVVFAIRPKAEQIETDWLREKSGDDPLDPAWYWYIYPPNFRDITDGKHTLNPPNKADPETAVHLWIEVDTELKAGIGWDIDQYGQTVPDSVVRNNEYNCNLDKLPDPNVFKLAPLPPIVATSQPVEDSSGGQDEGP